MIDPKTGTLHLPNNILLASGTNFDVLKEKLQQQTSIRFICEERYGLYQIIYLSEVDCENKLFQFELFFDKKILTGMLMDFRHADAGNPTREEWLTEQVGKLRQFDWGKVYTDEHPKFNVPLINIKYTKQD